VKRHKVTRPADEDYIYIFLFRHKTANKKNTKIIFKKIMVVMHVNYDAHGPAHEDYAELGKRDIELIMMQNFC